MSKKRNGKHISGDPRKNSKPMYYKGFGSSETRRELGENGETILKKVHVIDMGYDHVKNEFRSLMSEMNLSKDEICYNLTCFDGYVKHGFFEKNTCVQFFVKNGWKSIDIGTFNIMTIIGLPEEMEKHGFKGDRVGKDWVLMVKEYSYNHYWKKVC